MSLVKSKAIQLGFDATPTNNFLIYQPLTPDGTFRIANGNQGATTDIMTVTSGGSVTFAGTTNFSSLNFGAGSESAPSLFPTGDNNTGIWFPAADTFAVSTGGTQRLRITSIGNVGIGTSSPANKLHVIGPQGAVAALPTLLNQTMTIMENSFHNRMAMIVPTTAGYECGIAAYGSGDAYPRASISMVPADKYISFATGDGTTAQVTEKMRIDVNGNVGIGTTAPGSKLNVVGGGIAVGAITGENAFAPAAAGIVLAGSNQSGVSTYTSPGNSTTVASISYYADINTGYARYLDIAALGSTQGAASNIRFLTGSASATERMRIDGSGNIGIGLSSPGARFHIGTNASQANTTQTYLVSGGEGLRINTYDTGSAGLSGQRFVDIASIGAQVAGYGGGAIRLITNSQGSDTGSTRLFIKHNGLIGIGTEAPTAKLHITDSNLVFDGQGNINVFTSDSTTSDVGGSIAFGGRNGQGTDPYTFGKIRAAKESGGTWNGYMQFGTTSSNSAVVERMRIDSTGKVGIGTTAPNGVFHAMDSSNPNGTATFYFDNKRSYTVGTYGKTQVALSLSEGIAYNSASTRIMGYVEAGNEVDTTSAYGYLAFGTRSVNVYERMRINADGKVTMPYQPAFLAYTASSANGTLTIANYTVFTTFDGTKYNRGSHYNTSTKRFTAPVAGIYMFFWHISLNVANTYSITNIIINGAQYNGNDTFVANGSTGSAASGSSAMSMAVQLNANDYVELYNRNASTSYYSGHSYWGGYLLG